MLYESVRMQEVSECLYLKLRLNITNLWSVTAQSYKSSKRTGLETRFKFEWRQQPREEGMLFDFISYRCDNSSSSCRPTLTLTSYRLSVLLVGWRGLPQVLFRDLPQALCQIKTSMSITMLLWTSSPNLRQKLSVQRAQQDQAVLSGMGLVSWYFVKRHHLMIFSSVS